MLLFCFGLEVMLTLYSGRQKCAIQRLRLSKKAKKHYKHVSLRTE